MTEQFLVEIFVKTFLSVIEILILLAVIIKVLRIEASLTPGIGTLQAYGPLFSFWSRLELNTRAICASHTLCCW